ncbi:hypothetical protein B0H14DRAFT_3894133 [Mycena olivaceomarginata]|nr:hypothetical protein B0H14DRAFT_3894133 [Mycena olivaceomarginata]
MAANFQAAEAIGAFFCNDINWSNNCAHWKPLTSIVSMRLIKTRSRALVLTPTLLVLFRPIICAALSAPPSSTLGDLRNVYYDFNGNRRTV